MVIYNRFFVVWVVCFCIVGFYEVIGDIMVLLVLILKYFYKIGLLDKI